MKNIVIAFAGLLAISSSTQAQAAEWTNPTAVSNWSGKGESGSNQCQYKAGDGSVHGVANTIDNNFDTSWNAHPCRKGTWFLVYDLGEEKDITAVQMRSAGNGAHDPRKFELFKCSDANGSSCTKIKDCTRNIDDQQSTDNNKSYLSCTFTAKSRYFKLSMKGWGKRGSSWYEGSGANWQYNIRDVQFQSKSGSSDCAAGPTVIKGLGVTHYLSKVTTGEYQVNPVQKCPTGKYQVIAASITQDKKCADWPTQAAHQKVKTPGTDMAAPVFENKCKDTQWYDNGKCRNLSTCKSNEFQTKAPTVTSDRTCVNQNDFTCSCNAATGALSGSSCNPDKTYVICRYGTGCVKVLTVSQKAMCLGVRIKGAAEYHPTSFPNAYVFGEDEKKGNIRFIDYANTDSSLYNQYFYNCGSSMCTVSMANMEKFFKDAEIQLLK